MGRLSFSFDWEDPAGSLGPEEHRATWASLAVSVDGCAVSRVHHSRLRSVRDHVFIPLYPLAEWTALNWWRLLYDSNSTSQMTDRARALSHDTRYAREGFALPALSIEPMGEEIELAWRRELLPSCDLEFLEAGRTIVPRAEVEASLRQLVDAVVERTRLAGVTDTPLSREWDSIKVMGDQEIDFCRVGASLGQDPLDLSDEMRDAALSVGKGVPRFLWETFCAAADPSRVNEQLALYQAAVADVSAIDGGLSGLESFRDVIRTNRGPSPWERGYEAARRLRAHLGVEDEPPRTLDRLLHLLRVEPDEFNCSVRAGYESKHLFDGLVALTRSNGKPAFLLSKIRPESVRFAFCRVFYEYLSCSHPETALVTAAQTVREKTSRAFAAELLAPERALRSRVEGFALEGDDIVELAEEFGVSSLVIRHQLENHGIVTEFVP